MGYKRLDPDPELVLFKLKGGLLIVSSSDRDKLIGSAPAVGIGMFGIDVVEVLLW